MGLSVFFVNEMGIVGTNEFDAILLRQFNEHLVRFLLHGECLTIGNHRGVGHLMALKLQVIVVAENTMIPLDGLACTSNVVLQYLPGHLARNTSRANNQAFMIFLQINTIGTRTLIETIHPRAADQFDEVLVSLIVLCQHDEMVSAHVTLLFHLVLFPAMSHIHLAAKDGLEGFLAFLLPTLVHSSHIIEELLDAKHVAVVGDGHASHAVIQGLVHQFGDARLPV